jgi:magnesium chelatase family protein
MLARRLPTILPPMTFDEAIETTKIHSVAGLLSDKDGLIGTRPFRSPHHTISNGGLIGGGTALPVPVPNGAGIYNQSPVFLLTFGEDNHAELKMMRKMQIWDRPCGRRRLLTSRKRCLAGSLD